MFPNGKLCYFAVHCLFTEIEYFISHKWNGISVNDEIYTACVNCTQLMTVNNKYWSFGIVRLKCIYLH